MALEKIWVDKDGSGGWKRPGGKGERLIILHAGSTQGWIPNCQLVFKSKTHSSDYHDEMNIAHFMEWFEKQLIPNIPPRSLIILDNAKYHNGVIEKIPTKSSTKAVMKEWLDKHGISYDQKELKHDLFLKIQMCHPKAIYCTDEIASRHDHEVVRLPIAHCEFNPIELAWATTKEYVRKHNKAFTMREVQALTPLGLQQMIPEMWKKNCEHVMKIEDEYWEKDHLFEDAVEELRITLGMSDSSDSEGDDDDDEDTDNPTDDEDDEQLQKEESELQQTLREEEKALVSIMAEEQQYLQY